VAWAVDIDARTGPGCSPQPRFAGAPAQGKAVSRGEMQGVEHPDVVSTQPLAMHRAIAMVPLS
jgi:hypothetical protein